MRNNFTTDWAFGIKGAIENIVRNHFPNDLRTWPLLQTFDFEAYSLPGNYMAIILKDKLSGIPAGPGIAKDFPFQDFPSLPPKHGDIELWQYYLRSKFKLRAEDAAFLIPIRDSGRNDAGADYDLFDLEEQMFWNAQIHLVITTYKAHTQATMTAKPNQPTSITYNVSGTNTRVNINSKDSSVNTATIDSSRVFFQLREAISQVEDPHERKRVESSIEALESSFGTSEFLGQYQQFISTISNHITVFGPLLPALASLLS